MESETETDTSNYTSWFLCEFCKRGYREIDKLLLHRDEAHSVISELNSSSIIKRTHQPQPRSRTQPRRMKSNQRQLLQPDIQQTSNSTPATSSKQLKNPTTSVQTDTSKKQIMTATTNEQISDTGESDVVSVSDSVLAVPVVGEKANKSKEVDELGKTKETSEIVENIRSSDDAIDNKKVDQVDSNDELDDIQFLTEVAPNDEISVLKRGIPVLTSRAPIKRRRLSGSASVSTDNNGSGNGNGDTDTQGTAPEIFICAQCPRMCTTKASLDQHIKAAHKKVVPSVSTEPIVLDSDNDDDETSSQKNSENSHSTPNGSSKIIVTIDEKGDVHFDSELWKDVGQSN